MYICVYICVCFIRNISNIPHSVRIEAVATESTDQIQQFPAYLQQASKHPDKNYNSPRGERRQWRRQQFLIQKQHSGSRKALQAPCAVPCACQAVSKTVHLAETSLYAAEESSRSLWNSLCCSSRGILGFSHRISTCFSNTSTYVSGLQIHYLFLCLQVFPHITRNSKKFHSILGTSNSKHSKTAFLNILVQLVKFPNEIH